MRDLTGWGPSHHCVALDAVWAGVARWEIDVARRGALRHKPGHGTHPIYQHLYPGLFHGRARGRVFAGQL